MNSKCLRFFTNAPRALVAVLVLVTFMWSQHEMQRHMLLHVADQISRHHEQGLQNPTAELPCIECALLAGGAHAVPGSATSLRADIVNATSIAWIFASRTVSPDRYYSSRAPPLLL